MPPYLVRVTNKRGWVKPPIVANCTDESEVIKLMQALGDEGDMVEIIGIRPLAMTRAFGDVPEGSAVFRYDWIWPPDGNDPRPFEE